MTTSLSQLPRQLPRRLPRQLPRQLTQRKNEITTSLVAYLKTDTQRDDVQNKTRATKGDTTWIHS